MVVKVPEQWPKEVEEKYEPIRMLGSGGFASVILAKRKEAEAGKPKLVAIKVVGSHDVTRQEVGYAHREMDILAELQHPNVMKVIEHWEPPRKDHRCAAIMALSYSKGPTLDHLLRKGGALSTTFGRIVCAQLVDVLAYLHSRAVLHRDIKPDNLIVSGAAYEQDEIWDEQEGEVSDWAEVRKKWHVTLVDFGFARALSPSDLAKQAARPTSSAALDASGRSTSSSGRRSFLGMSISHKFTRQMSALGNRHFAAPEVMHDVKPNSKHKALRVSGDESVDLTGNLAEGLSSYGMLAESYSAGCTIQFAVTGVPPNLTYNEAVASQKGAMSKLGKLFGRKKKNNKDGKKAERKVQYRPLADVPAEVKRLIEGLTKSKVEERTSIRSARLYPWVDDVLETEAPSRQEADYLPFVKAKDAPQITATEE